MTDESALAEDVLARYVDPATAQFDAALDAADLDETTRRTLRFWHRQSLRGVRDYAARVLPPMFSTVAEAQADAERRTADAAAALAAAIKVTEYDEPDAPAVNAPAGDEHPARTIVARLASGS
ncbi:MAG: hypothetical protein LC640_11395 [Frankia sp.]|nr:hypothetical protein [Frankia sp.]